MDADQVRKFATELYAKPALAESNEFSIAVRSVELELRKRGLERNRFPLICSALKSKKFLTDNDLVIDRWEGPASGQSSTVIYHYRRAGGGHPAPVVTETPKERAYRLTGKILGLMEDEIAARGGAEGFMRWVRSVDDEEQP